MPALKLCGGVDVEATFQPMVNAPDALRASRQRVATIGEQLAVARQGGHGGRGSSGSVSEQDELAPQSCPQSSATAGRARRLVDPAERSPPTRRSPAPLDLMDFIKQSLAAELRATVSTGRTCALPAWHGPRLAGHGLSGDRAVAPVRRIFSVTPPVVTTNVAACRDHESPTGALVLTRFGPEPPDNLHRCRRDRLGRRLGHSRQQSGARVRGPHLPGPGAEQDGRAARHHRRRPRHTRNRRHPSAQIAGHRIFRRGRVRPRLRRSW